MIVYNKIGEASWNRSNIVELTVFKEFWSTNKFEENSQPSDQKLWLTKDKRSTKKVWMCTKNPKASFIKSRSPQQNNQ